VHPLPRLQSVRRGEFGSSLPAWRAPESLSAAQTRNIAAHFVCTLVARMAQNSAGPPIFYFLSRQFNLEL
jgi:hypothetical protein